MGSNSLGNVLAIPRADYEPTSGAGGRWGQPRNSLLDLLSHEAGRERAENLGGILEHYIPPEMRQQMNVLGMLNPVNEMGEAVASSRAAFTDPDNRGKHVVNALTNTAGAAAPLAAARYGVPVANALADTLLGFSPAVSNAADTARRFAADEAGNVPIRPKPPEAQRGDEILNMLKSGRGDEVTDEMLDMGDPTLNARLNMYLYDNYDLPMDKMNRHYRASKSGFDIEPLGGKPSSDTLYHQTPADIQAFELGRNGDGVTYGHSGGGAIWTSDTPHRIPAAHNTIDESSGEFLEGVNIMPVAARQSKRVGINEKWNPDYNINEQFPSVVTMDESARLASEGFTHGSVGIEKAFFDPRNLRSRFARFDPRLAHLRNLSASAAGVGLLPYLLADEE